MSNPAAETSPLEYSPTPTIGSVTVRESAESLLLTFLPSTYRVLHALIPLMICSTIGGGLAVTLYLSLGKSPGVELTVTMLLPMVILFLGISSSIANLMRVVVPPSVEVNARKSF